MTSGPASAASARTLRVAAIQLASGTDAAANVARALALVEEAARAGARYIQLPEYTTYLGPPAGAAGAAETVPGPATDLFAAAARRLGVVVHVGSLLERTAGRPANTSVVLGPDGRVAATYRKVHLFDVDVPGAVAYRESDALVAGDELVAVDLDGLRLGLSVCFDLRFPDLYGALARAGAQVLAIPAAFNAVTGAAHWHVLTRARAIENHAFVVAAAQAGRTPEGVATFGHALVVDPWGVILAEAQGDEPQVVAATLDLDAVTARRAQIDVLALRRPDAYARGVRVARGPEGPSEQT